MTNVIELAKQCPDVTISLKVGELIEAVTYCVNLTRKELEKQITDANTETYPSPAQVSKILNVSPVTLWRWHKSNYLRHIDLGGTKRYRMSEVQALLDKGKGGKA